MRAGASPDGELSLSEDKSFKGFYQYVLGADLCRTLLNLVLPYNQCKRFAQKYKRQGLMVNVCVLLLLAPEKLMFYVMPLYIL